MVPLIKVPKKQKERERKSEKIHGEVIFLGFGLKSLLLFANMANRLFRFLYIDLKSVNNQQTRHAHWIRGKPPTIAKTIAQRLEGMRFDCVSFILIIVYC